MRKYGVVAPLDARQKLRIISLYLGGKAVKVKTIKSVKSCKIDISRSTRTIRCHCSRYITLYVILRYIIFTL